MTYSSPNQILADDVANQFWNTYFSSQILSGTSFGTGSGAEGTARTVQYPQSDKSGAKTGQQSGTVYDLYYQNDSGFPSDPGSLSAPSRAITGTTLKASTSTMNGTNVFNAFKTEIDRFRGYYASYRWIVTRTYYHYQGNQTQTALDQTRARWSGSSAFTYTAPSNSLGSSDTATTSEFNTLFSNMSNNYASQRTGGSGITTTSSYTQCHNSCHTSCHGSRSRR
jgi:hypothetical protein